MPDFNPRKEITMHSLETMQRLNQKAADDAKAKQQQPTTPAQAK